MGAEGKHAPGQAHQAAGQDHGGQAPRAECGHVACAVQRVLHAPPQAHLVGCHRRHHARQQGGPAHLAQCRSGQHFKRKHRAGQWRAKDRSKARGDARHQDHPALPCRQLEAVAQLIGQGPAHLHRRAFAPHRSPKQMRDHGAAQDQRRHAQRHHLAWIVNFIDQQVVARIHRAPPFQVQPTHGKTSERQTQNQPPVRLTRARGPVQAEQKQRRRRARQHRHQPAQHQPLQGRGA